MKLVSYNNNGRGDPPSFFQSKMHLQTVKHTYLAWGFIVFNMLYGTVMFLCSPPFARIVTQFSTFSLVYALALVAAVFALRDRHGTLLYPIVIVTSLMVFVSIIASAFLASNYLYCSLKLSSSSVAASPSADNASLTTANKRIVGILNAGADDYDGNDASMTSSMYSVEVIQLYRNICKCSRVVNSTSELVIALVLLAVFASKLAEFIIYRRLMKLLHLAHHPNNIAPQPPPFNRHVIQPVDVIGDLRKKPSSFRSLERNLAMRNGANVDNAIDSDDDMVVYERTLSRQSSQSSGTRLKPGGNVSAKMSVSGIPTVNKRASLPTVAGSKKVIA